MLAAAAAAGIAVITGACNGDDSPRRGPGEMVTFSDVTVAAGIDIGDAVWGTFGAAWADFDNDGNVDLFITRHAQMPALYRGDGAGRFTDVTRDAGLDSGIVREKLFLLDRHGCAWGDYDADALIDLYCATGAQDGLGTEDNQLFSNEGNGSFSEIAAELGIDDGPGRGRAASWMDYDTNGFLDLYVANDRREGNNSKLFRGTGNGFADATAAAGLDIADDLAGGGSAWSDFDGDHDTDLFVGMFDGLRLYENRGDGTFALDSGGARGLDAKRVRSVSTGDFDNDGDLDVFAACIDGARLYRNAGDGTFDDVTPAAGVGVTRAAAGVWGDFDNDADLDLFVVREYDPDSKVNLPDALFINDGRGRFTDGGVTAGIDGPETGAGDSAAIADFDRDGALDVLVTNGASQVDIAGGPIYSPLAADKFELGRVITYIRVQNPATLLRNETDAGHWLELRLIGSPANTSAYGAKVSLRAGDIQQYRELGDAVVQYGQSDRVIHFGLGEQQTVDQVVIRWPNGDMQTLTNLGADEILEIEQNSVSSQPR
jgi:hypothetical protein